MARLHFRGHIGKRDYAVNTSPPTISGSAISGQTLTRGAGTWTTVESTNVGFAYVWQSADAPLFENWTDIVGATNTTLLLSGTHIGKKLRVGEARINGDGQPPFVYSQPTLVVQDAPAIPLSVTGTPVTTANQGDPASFIVSFDGGSGTYTPSLLNAPAGSSVTMLSNGDQATVTLGTANVGSFGNIIVRVSDGIVTADLAAFTFTVNAIGSIQTVIPGGGWPGLTTAVNGVSLSTRRGSAGVGYNGAPTIRIEEPPFMDIDTPYIQWVHAYHVGPMGVFDTNHPTFGIEKMSIAADGGAWLTVFAQYNAAEDFWGFPVRIDPAQWSDGYPTLGTSSVRTMRYVAWPINGLPTILQTEPPDYAMAFRFTTNANGTFTRAKRYFGSNGSSGNTGLAANSPKPNPEEAAATFTPSGGRNYGDLELVYTGGTSMPINLAARTTTVRPMKISALPGLTASQCVFTSQGSQGFATKMVHLAGVSYVGFSLNGPTSGAALYTEDVVRDGGAANSQLDNQWYNGFSGGVWTKGGTITNYGNAHKGERSVVKTYTLTCSRNWIQNVLFARAARLGTLPDSGGYHPDLFQYLKSATNILGDGWQYGCIAINLQVDSAAAQGPFFKDNNYIGNIYMIKCNFNLSNSGRNTLGVFLNNSSNPQYPYTILRNSMFWDCNFLGGNSSRGTGHCEDVIWKNIHLNGGPPLDALVYEAPH
jgi:hypothetical protein